MLAPPLVDLLWLRMASRYGHAWTSNFGPKPEGFAAAEWAEALGNLHPEQIRAGLASDLLRGDSFPPSSALFLKLCLETLEPQPFVGTFQRLPPPTTIPKTTEERRAHLAQMVGDFDAGAES